MDMSLLEGEINRLNWRKSARSINAGNCTEVASSAGVVVVKDSQDPHGLEFLYSANSWRAFLNAARTGHFDRDRLIRPVRWRPGYAIAWWLMANIEPGPCLF